MTPALLADTIRHALNDDECADWFARSHDRQHTPDDLTDSDRSQDAGGFNVFHAQTDSHEGQQDHV
jgi:hypothetical protein